VPNSEVLLAGIAILVLFEISTVMEVKHQVIQTSKSEISVFVASCILWKTDLLKFDLANCLATDLKSMFCVLE
jgi:hypothetical protein